MSMFVASTLVSGRLPVNSRQETFRQWMTSMCAQPGTNPDDFTQCQTIRFVFSEHPNLKAYAAISHTYRHNSKLQILIKMYRAKVFNSCLNHVKIQLELFDHLHLVEFYPAYVFNNCIIEIHKVVGIIDNILRVNLRVSNT